MVNKILQPDHQALAEEAIAEAESAAHPGQPAEAPDEEPRPE